MRVPARRTSERRKPRPTPLVDRRLGGGATRGSHPHRPADEQGVPTVTERSRRSVTCVTARASPRTPSGWSRAGTPRSDPTPPSRRSPVRGLGEQGQAGEGSRGWARAPTAPGRAPSSRCGGAGRGCGGIRPGVGVDGHRRRLRRPRAWPASAAQASGRGGMAAYDGSRARPRQLGGSGVVGQVRGWWSGHQVLVGHGHACPRPGVHW